jgi:hypothetical protein
VTCSACGRAAKITTGVVEYADSVLQRIQDAAKKSACSRSGESALYPPSGERIRLAISGKTHDWSSAATAVDIFIRFTYRCLNIIGANLAGGGVHWHLLGSIPLSLKGLEKRLGSLRCPHCWCIQFRKVDISRRIIEL